jgi:hypothetical protein
MAIYDRRVGWHNRLFYYRFRELFTDTAFRYGIACPPFCLMPDHMPLLTTTFSRQGIEQGKTQPISPMT